MTEFETQSAASLLALVNDYIVALSKVGTLAKENDWKVLQKEVEDKLGLMEKRARQLIREVIK